MIGSQAKIFVAGHRGLIGSAVMRRLRSAGYENILTRLRSELDLTDQKKVNVFFREEQPEYVILAAGQVGGIAENSRYPADFIYNNLMIQANVMKAARETNVGRLIFFGSSCMYPLDAPQPFREESLLQGPLEKTSLAYAVAKLAGVHMCLAFNQQDGAKRFIPVIPNSTYGENDDLNPESGHVLSALVRRLDDARKNQVKGVELWGSGTPRREFIHSSDVAEACLTIMTSDLSDVELPVNIGTGEDISIKELAEMIGEITGFAGQIGWDTSRPDGAPQKLLDHARISSLGWQPAVGLREGIQDFYQWYRARSAS